MTFLAWSPWREIDAFRREVERAFDSFGRGRTYPLPGGPLLAEQFARSYPYINLSEDKDHVYIEAIAPGVDSQSLEISIVGDTVRVAGEKQAIKMEVKPEAYHRNERQAGKFIRTITLPVEVDGDKVTADYANGLLLIKLAKAEAAKPRQISVKVA
ncbi:MAG TPA: Hsp20/alpha crystallin family protein [Candidatus Bathyarchaeia archaeon]|nr:Hsp20/alpha crystallin family protein [Candidatus Bathyarchaeia archaeon]